MAEPRTRIDPTDPDIYLHGIPHAEFAELRRTDPVCWIPQPRGSAGFDDEGYWAVTRHTDVMTVSRDSDTYSSRENTAIVRFQPDMTRDRIEMQQAVLLNMDPPQHTKQRAIVSRGFTPRAVNSLRAALQTRAERIVHTALATGDLGDFVTEIACELPLQAIAELLGVPQEDRRNVFEWSNSMIGYDDPEFSGADPMESAMGLLGYAMQMADERQSCPRDDIVTTLVKAEIDGSHLSVDEFGFFVLMLAVAGNETTRNAISHGMLALLSNPAQWDLYKETRPRTAVDEFVRWGSPINAFQRTALHDTVLADVPIRTGQRVAMFYGSANYDDDVFAAPHTFDITRSPNPHLGFGGSGAHFCLGANLARLEIDLIFNALADHMPGITLAGPAQRLRSGWINGIKHLPVRYR
ncbi:cholest-4-en-3-one 26-monooxygenase [Actinoplanes campanulatus]|uniref:Cholest-4-en-3-one 26-monooxygenase n=1 Tax=Actinoplanes campanulatus TaxID=113559 RepID=A0A7W5AIQ1_9ACTN|nr:cytochrome P450 [Actinoplanes campanulatus]MBB3096509.1 cholest-4-en-3-one 26-monooxygenase [Actinoplanes campanulatus]GGN17748.1 cytochrome P450 [Actinoplanes campanulatus]GID38576.1 cytochrome P450 [Actinoplanes campanulatus]